jgi:hypothetical protein
VVVAEAAGKGDEVVADETAVAVGPRAVVGARDLLASILAIRCFAELISPEIF